MAWQSGQSLYGDRYTIRKKLGQGGFGITYLAEDEQGQQVVIKTLTDEIMNSLDDTGDHDKFLRDFEKEALSLALCRHPHIVQIENFFIHQGFPCIVMEYVAGLDLGKRLRQQGALPEAEAVRYVQQVGDGLQVIHQKGRLHRDIKPRNIMVRANTQEAVLIDFGIAREFLPDVTQTHTRAATDGFAPIEQYDNQARRGKFTDVYALAATLSALITGANPQPSSMRAVKDRFKVPDNCSGAVRTAIEQGMALEPEARPQTVEAWLELLQPDTPRPTPWTPQPQTVEAWLELLQPRRVPRKPQIPESVHLPELPVLQIPQRYQQLAELLKAGDWQEADEETAKQMLIVANRSKEGWLDEKSIKEFPCEDLHTIDQLWVDHSQGHFGFSVQERVYQAWGGTREYDKQVWNDFHYAVGWPRKYDFLSYEKKLNSNMKKKEGHFPYKYISLIHRNHLEAFITFFNGCSRYYLLGMEVFVLVIVFRSFAFIFYAKSPSYWEIRVFIAFSSMTLLIFLIFSINSTFEIYDKLLNSLNWKAWVKYSSLISRLEDCNTYSTSQGGQDT